MNNHHLSVAMCTYNGAQFLQEQLDSIALQTRLPDELVVCDDGSTDATLEILWKFRCMVSFPIKIHRNRERLGSTKNFEKSINLCKGDLVILSDQDDVWLHDKLQKIQTAFRRFPNAVGVFSEAELIGVNGQRFSKSLWRSVGVTKRKTKRLERGGQEGFRVLLQKNVITGATFAFKKDVYEVVGSIPEPWVHDAWIAINIVRKGPIASIPEPLVRYRQHESNQIGVRKQTVGHRLRDVQSIRKALRNMEILKRSMAEQAADGGYLQSLDEKISHLRVRASDRVNVQDVVREVVRGRYRKYSDGFMSCAKDCCRALL